MLEEVEKGEIPMKKIFKVKFKPDSTPLVFSSMFDSGNMQKIQILSNNYVAITPAHDCSGSAYESLSKGWFHFSVSGASMSTKLKLIVKKMSQLNSHTKISQYFKPVYKYQKEDWKRVENAKTITKQDDTQLHIQFQITKNTTVYFAYTYPFSYQQCQIFLKKMEKQAKKIKSIEYIDDILIYSPQKRNIHIITLTSSQNQSSRQEQIQNSFLFPLNQKQKKLKVFTEKKVVFVTARVHPAEAPSSHTFNGVLKFLLSKDARAYFLRKHFLFILVPMLNPDGVSNGHYRMDVLNQNLNRFYQDPDPVLQPSAYAVKKLGEFYHNKNKLCFYMDLHAHPQRKGNFIYGNALQSNQSQVETQLFPKILSLNCIQFDYDNSSFDQKHMTLKDRNQNLTKEGCGRVVFQKEFQQIYSYTMECGYTCSNYLNQIVSIDKGHRKFQKHSIISDETQNIKSPFYGGGKKNILFSIQTYQTLGKAICVSILDLFNLNPASRLPNTPYKTLQGIRKELSFQICKNLSLTNNSNFRIYYMKQNSQQGKKHLNQINTSKTIGSVDNIKQKTSMQKKKIVVSSQFLFLPQKNFNLNTKQIKSQNQISPKIRIKNSILPKVNLFKLANNIIETNETKSKRI